MKQSLAAAGSIGAVAIVATLGLSGTASAGCHLIDCVENVYIEKKDVAKHSCEQLWILRNSVYDDAGYCFQSARGKKWFVNDGCTYSDQAEVPLNDYQRHNVDVLAGVEAENGC
jgi:hypothetical protein